MYSKPIAPGSGYFKLVLQLFVAFPVRPTSRCPPKTLIMVYTSTDMSTRKQQFKPSPKKRFAVGAEVRVRMPGVNGVVTQFDMAPSVMGEYWHTVRTVHGDRREPGSNLELVPVPTTNAKPKESLATMTDSKLLPSDQALSLLRAQVQQPVENLRQRRPRCRCMERVALTVVERTFGEHSRNANHFATTVSYARQTVKRSKPGTSKISNRRRGCSTPLSKNSKSSRRSDRRSMSLDQGVFFAGQTFDALSLASRIFATAKVRLLLIDGYIGADTLNIPANNRRPDRHPHQATHLSAGQDALSRFQNPA